MSGRLKLGMNTFTVRFLYTRGEGTKYSAQLDMIRIFQRAFRRAELPIEYSSGFNPHPNIVMGLPLGMGITSDTEYCDVGLTEKVDINTFITKLNAALPSSIEVKKADYRNNNKNIMSAISHMISVIHFPNIQNVDDVKQQIKDKMQEAQFIVVKKAKQKNNKKRNKNADEQPRLKEVDVKPMIHGLGVNGEMVLNDKNEVNQSISGHSVAYEEFEFLNKCVGEMKGGITVLLFADAGSASNLNPDLFARTLIADEFFTIHRAKLYVQDRTSVISPMSLTALK